MTEYEKFWDMTADGFEQTEKRFEPIAIQTIENTKKYLRENDVVLDYGCAKGTKTLALAGHIKRIYGIDVSSKMIAGARRKADEGKYENVVFDQGTIFDERFQRESFDGILAYNILHLLEDPPRAVRRITELLKPGGLLISSTPCLGDKMTIVTRLQFYPFLLLSKIGLIPPYLKRFKIPELKGLMNNGYLQILESEKLFLDLTSYFIVAKKI